MSNNCETCTYRIKGELNFHFDKKGRHTVGNHPDKCKLTGDEIKRPDVKKCDGYKAEGNLERISKISGGGLPATHWRPLRHYSQNW